MNREKILNIFYNHIVKEAVNGRVDCYMIYNVIFNTNIKEKNIELIGNNYNNELIIPTLQIKNIREFDDLLVKYVNIALQFYDDNNFCAEVLQEYNLDGDKGISKEKTIMTLLWSNATIEDFNDPCAFLRKRINYFNLSPLEDYINSQIVGYSEVLDCDIKCTINKARIENETPYYLETKLIKPNTNDCLFIMPNIYFALNNNKADIYAIQNSNNNFDNNKKISRKMYKVNDGFIEDNYNNYDVANLKDITPSFVVAANILCGLLKSNNICDIDIVSILICRFNGKIKTLEFIEDNGIKRNYDPKKLREILLDRYEKTFAIQMNLTDKFLRTFRRLGYHHSSIGITNYPMDISSSMSLKVYNMEDTCNNKLLEETFNFDNVNILKR